MAAQRPKTPGETMKKSLTAAVLSTCGLLFAAAIHGQAAPKAPAAKELPDWSGVWRREGSTVFDPSTVKPAGGVAGIAGVRMYPPLTPAWEEKYRRNVELVAADRFPDPLTNCGLPAGFPRLLNLPDVYEFVVRPEQTWILTENGPNIMRIYTDGRSHPAPADMWSTYTGDSVGHWEGDTLVFDTIGLKGEDGTILDRTGFVLSGEARITARIRKVDQDTLEAQMAIDDPVALTKTWNVVKRYKRLPAGTRVYDYACGENNRNPYTPAGQTLTLGPDGQPLDKHIEK